MRCRISGGKEEKQRNSNILTGGRKSEMISCDMVLYAERLNISTSS